MKKKIQKPFNVEAAKNGAKVETKSGKPARIVCYDRKGVDCPILALVSKDKVETCLSYTIDGLLGCSENSEYDLVIVEEVECPERPKFNVGDWVIATNEGHSHNWLITAVTSYCYELQDTERRKDSISQIIVDNLCHLWTLNDAKPGDVLVCENDKCPFIFKEFFYSSIPTAYCGINAINSICIGTNNPWTYVPVRPATYEERRQLFNKLEEEGYKWDAESLTLTKIPKKWRDNEDISIKGYFINKSSRIEYHLGCNTHINYSTFATKKQAKSALAMARISQIMANDERFGGVVTNEEWNERSWYNIIRVKKALIVRPQTTYEFLAFHTSEQADLFLEENRDLIRDYYMMD